MLLVDDLLKVPITLSKQILKGIKEEVDREMGFDEEKLQDKLKSLQVSYDLEEITEKEYDRQEAEILDQLEKIKGGR